jgi:CubicO group peptidase (beta-lactamase class C family)
MSFYRALQHFSNNARHIGKQSIMKLLLAFSLSIFILFAHAQKLSLPALKDSIKKVMEEKHIPGIMIALVNTDSVIWAGGIGMADLEKKIRVTENSLFRIGSISKSFAALAILKLIGENKFRLTSKLADLAPEIPFKNPWENIAPVRVINLLEHTAGFDDMHFANFENEEGSRRSTLQQALQHVNTLRSRWKPGTRMSYSNPGYAILGYIVEKYSGMKYEDYIAKVVFAPLQMTQTNFEYATKAPYAKGYSFDGKNYHEALPVAINGNAAGAISSCATDMANYVRMYLNQGRVDTLQLFPAAIFRDIESSHSTLAGEAGMHTGYGLANYSKMIGKKVKEYFRGHNGGINGFTSDFGYSRTWKVGYAISCNYEGGTGRIAGLVVQYLLQGKTSEEPSPHQLNKKLLAGYEGTYVLNSNRNEILKFGEDVMATANLYIRNDTLFYHEFLSPRTALIPVTDFQFRKKGELAPTFMVTHDEGADVCFNGTDCLIRVSPAKIWTLRIAIGLTLVLGLSLVPFVISWIVMAMVRKLSVRELLIRSLPLMAFLSFALMLYATANLLDLKNIVTASKINGLTLTIFISSLLLPLFAFAAILTAVMNFSHVRSRLAWSYVFASAAGFCFLSLWLYQYGWIGLRMWTY